jgi:hypothetical protein
VGGEIGFYRLESWWLSAFSEAERRHIEALYYHPSLVKTKHPLTKGRGPSVHPRVCDLLLAMARPLERRAEDRSLAARVLSKSEECANAKNDVIALHFTYEAMIRLHAKWKVLFLDAEDAAFAACYKQARIAEEVREALHERYPMRPLPSHSGYELMVTMLTEAKNYAQAITVCERAKSQGWPGDWVGQIQEVAKASGYAVRYISPAGMTHV